jgi:hypothetical protein
MNLSAPMDECKPATHVFFEADYRDRARLTGFLQL